MIPQHVLVGGGVVALSLMALVKERLLLENSARGQALVRRFGAIRAPWVFRGFIAAAILFGSLLAAGIIRPVQW